VLVLPVLVLPVLVFFTNTLRSAQRSNNVVPPLKGCWSRTPTTAGGGGSQRTMEMTTFETMINKQTLLNTNRPSGWLLSMVLLLSIFAFSTVVLESRSFAAPFRTEVRLSHRSNPNTTVSLKKNVKSNRTESSASAAERRLLSLIQFDKFVTRRCLLQKKISAFIKIDRILNVARFHSGSRDEFSSSCSRDNSIPSVS
jgi:hypothetical protein